MVIRTSHVITAVLLHAIVIGLLLVGFHCTRKVPPPAVMQATLVDSKPAVKAKPAPEPPKPDDRQIEQERKQREEEQRKKQEQAEEQKKLEEQKKADQLEKQKQEDQRKAQAIEQARQKKQEEERKAKEELARREEEKKKKEQELQDQLRKEMTSEETERRNAANAAATASAQNAWIEAIRAKVVPNFNPPPGTPDNFQCRVHVSLLPGGQVVGVKLLESCGNPILDGSVERAIRKSDPLPTPDNPAAFDRELEFTFVPHL